MNSERPILPPMATEPGASRKGVPLGMAITLGRAVEFLTVAVTGLVLIGIGVWDFGGTLDTHSRVVLLGAAAYALLAESLGAYDIDAQFSVRKGWNRVVMAWLLSAVFLITLGYLLKESDQVSRGWAVSWLALGAVSLCSVRAIGIIGVRRLKTRGTFNERVAIFGTGQQGLRFAQYVQSHERLTITLIGMFDDRSPERRPADVAGVPVLGNLTTLIEMIRDGLVDQVVVALPWAAERRLQEIVTRLALTPVKVRLAPDLVAFTYARRPVVILGDVPVMTLFDRPIGGLSAVAKNIEDKLLTLIILAFIWPVLLAVAIAIKLDSPGPILFRQPREGFNNRTFDCFKFRSMYHNQLEFKNINQATRDDPRVTRVGRILRRTSLDELPQLFNVLLGDMSLVGPRPHAPSTRAGGRLFSDVVQSYAARHKVKPGITGWAQVCGWRGETDTEEKLIKRFEHDLYYIDNWSIMLDFYILIRTVGAVLLPKNAF
ncbi:undecaprenyl-phosphate glucose phosphotransferase [Sphingomonas sp. IBVSS1]|nr:undecaprenyl-phosphate glucose phosphotransferase [Sphingomonas sp. IBVSS1]